MLEESGNGGVSAAEVGGVNLDPEVVSEVAIVEEEDEDEGEGEGEDDGVRLELEEVVELRATDTGPVATGLSNPIAIQTFIWSGAVVQLSYCLLQHQPIWKCQP